MINSARLLTNILQWLNHDIDKITGNINDRYLLNQRMNRIMNRLSEGLSLHKVCLYNELCLSCEYQHLLCESKYKNKHKSMNFQQP